MGPSLRVSSDEPLFEGFDETDILLGRGCPKQTMVHVPLSDVQDAIFDPALPAFSREAGIVSLSTSQDSLAWIF